MVRKSINIGAIFIGNTQSGVFPIKCVECKKKLTLKEIWRYYKFKYFTKFETTNKYIEQTKKPLCTLCFIINLQNWGESCKQRIDFNRK